MSLGVASKMRTLAADGYFGKKDLQSAVHDMLDGRGVTCIEKKRFEKQMDAFIADPRVKVTGTAQDAYAHFKTRLKEHDCDSDTHAPGLDRDEVKDILSLYVDRSRSYSSSESGGGRRYTSRSSTSTSRSYRGGE